MTCLLCSAEVVVKGRERSTYGVWLVQVRREEEIIRRGGLIEGEVVREKSCSS